MRRCASPAQSTARDCKCPRSNICVNKKTAQLYRRAHPRRLSHIVTLTLPIPDLLTSGQRMPTVCNGLCLYRLQLCGIGGASRFPLRARNKQTDRQTDAQTPVNVLPTPRLPSVWAITESKNINWPTAAQQRACLQCYSTTSDLIPVAIPLRCNAIKRDRDIEQVATVMVATGRIVADTHIILSY